MPGYLVTYVYRAHSSGWGEPVEKIFTSLEKASKYLLDLFNGYVDDFGDENWDETDMFADQEMTTPAPVPTKSMGEILFSVDALKEFLVVAKRTYDNTIYGPWSDFECQIPFEIKIKEIEID